MSSPVVLVMNQISTDVEALVPPDRTAITYHELDGRTKRRGASSDRSFYFSLPQRGEPVSHAGPELTTVEWEFSLVMRLSQVGRSVEAMADVAANESNLIARSVETRAAWPAAVIDVFTGGVSAVQDGDDKGDLILEMQLRATCQETD